MLKAAFIAALACLALSACGIKGPLYLPQVPAPKARPAAPAQAPAADHNKPAPQDSAP